MEKESFERGLHYSATVTPAKVRVICICDNCDQSFTVSHFQCRFSEDNISISADSKNTLIVPYDAIKNIPTQLQKRDWRKNQLAEVEAELMKVDNGTEELSAFYNSISFASIVWIQYYFQANKELRADRNYGLK